MKSRTRVAMLFAPVVLLLFVGGESSAQVSEQSAAQRNAERNGRRRLRCALGSSTSRKKYRPQVGYLVV